MWPFRRAEPVTTAHTDAFIEHLRQEVAFWRLLFRQERQRAELSIDHRLSERGLGPVTLPLRQEMPEPLNRAIQDLLTNPEFTEAGRAE